MAGSKMSKRDLERWIQTNRGAGYVNSKKRKQANRKTKRGRHWKVTAEDYRRKNGQV